MLFRSGRDDILRRLLESLRTGFYVSVVREGDVAQGDAIQIVERAKGSMTVADIVALRFGYDPDRVDLERASRLEHLSRGWREDFQEMLTR